MGLVKPKKFLGQHFLKDLSIAKDIADTVDVCPDLPIQTTAVFWRGSDCRDTVYS